MDDLTERQDMDQHVDELEKPMELKLRYENLEKNFKHLKKIPLNDIKLATNDFSESLIVIKVDGYYTLYKSQLDHFDTVTVAIKRISLEYENQEEVFWKEIEMLTKCKHHSIVTLLGYCDEGSEKILVTEDLSHGRLADYLEDYFFFKPFTTWTWSSRLNICLDVANGLNYLHSEMEDQKRAIKGDIRSHNIAIDENGRAKMYDFGFSVFLPPNQEGDALHDANFIRLVGEYLDPEYVVTDKLKQESDVYSFGVILFEIICGRMARDPIYLDKGGLVYLARQCFQEGKIYEMIDPTLKDENGKIKAEKDALDTYLNIAYKCVAETQDERPTMEAVVKELEKALAFQEKNFKHLKKIQLNDIKLATNDFSYEFMIFEVYGYYKLYKAQVDHFEKEDCYSIQGNNSDELHKTCKTVAIKRFAPEYEFQEEVFLKEIEMLTTCKHHNIVTVLGICDEGFEKILVMEHFSNGRLANYLENINDMPVMSWERRLKICLDVANVLDYLHSEMEDQKRVIKGDIRSHNIALDENGRAKIDDFGFSVFLPPNQEDDALHDARFIWVGNGYLDPEYVMTGRLKRESDVYSFGVVLFEIFCGRMANDPIYEYEGGLAYVARQCFDKGKIYEMIDPTLKERGPNKDSLDSYLNIAYKCVAETQDERPTMKALVKELEKALTFQKKNLEHLKKIPLNDIKLATDNFSETFNVFTGYYWLYKAQLDHFDTENIDSGEGKNNDELPKRGKTVAIKRILPEYEIREEAFLTELEMLTTCKHRNIVNLLGFCDEGSEKILVTEHLSNGRLAEFLENTNDMPVLSWEKRLNICLDVANGLNYLHSEMEDQKRIINRDIRSDYIGLDENWRAKIVDFGLSVFLPANQDDDALHHNSPRIWGTQGYLDPEYVETGRLKRESDVYNLGVVMIEIFCGRMANDPIYLNESDKGLAYVARQCFLEGKLYEMIDPILKEENGKIQEPNKDSLDTYLNIAYKCLEETQDERPTMKAIIKELEKALTFQSGGTREDPSIAENLISSQEKSLVS